MIEALIKGLILTNSDELKPVLSFYLLIIT